MPFWLNASVRVAITVAALTGSVVAAQAEIKFCNHYSKPVYVAIAYPQAYDDGSTGYVSRGWLDVESGDCQEFDTSLHVPYFFFRGETNWFQIKGGRQRTVWGDDANKFLTNVASFNVWDADRKKSTSTNETLLGFIKSVADGADISETVTFEADGQHDTQSVDTGVKH